jgi:aldose 1-epimerase
VPRPGYPFRLVVEATYALGDAGLTTTVVARNAGDTPLPWGTGGHPYLVAGDGRGPVDPCELRAPATRVLELDPERLLPADPPVTGPVARGVLDFTTARPIGDTALDHAFTGIVADDDGWARCRLVDPATGTGSQLTWDPEPLPWLQLHTADVPAPETTRAALAVEPMTCPPDSFRSGVDLVVLGPAEEHSVSWTIGPVGD